MSHEIRWLINDYTHVIWDLTSLVKLNSFTRHVKSHITLVAIDQPFTYLHLYIIIVLVDVAVYHFHPYHYYSFCYQVLTGNCDHFTPVLNILQNPITARFVRLYPKTYRGAPCLRVELYGCDAWWVRQEDYDYKQLEMVMVCGIIAVLKFLNAYIKHLLRIILHICMVVSLFFIFLLMVKWKKISFEKKLIITSHTC